MDRGRQRTHGGVVSALVETGEPMLAPERTGRRVLRSLVETRADWVPSLQRLALGGVVLAHGMQKALGWFGGGGISGTVTFFQDVLHLPAPIALLVTFSDFVGSLALLIGFMTRIAAVGTGLVMLGAVATVHFQNGFFMNWFGNQPGEGFEFHLLALALVAALIRSGAGRASLDALLMRRV